VLYGVGFVLMSQISEPWHLFVVFALFVGLGMSTHDVVTLSTIARWFSRRRGIMTGVVKLGTAAGQVVLPLLAAFLIAGFGWQVALITLGVAASVVLLIAAFLMARPPQAEVQKSTEDAAGLTLAEARSGRVMWTLCLLQFLFLTVLTTIPTHIAVHGMDMGLSRVEAGGLLSVIGASSAIGRLIVGGFADRIGGRGGYLFCFSGLILALGILVLTFGSTSLILILAIYGCVHGGLFTVVSPTVAEYFGTRAHGAIFGVILFFGTIGGALGPVLAGWTFDVTGTYIWAFSTLLAFSIIGFVLTLSLPRPAGQAEI
jgi:MFS family permease